MDRTQVEAARKNLMDALKVFEDIAADPIAKDTSVKDEHGFRESVAMIIETFLPKADYFNRRMIKGIEAMPRLRKRKLK